MISYTALVTNTVLQKQNIPGIMQVHREVVVVVIMYKSRQELAFSERRKYIYTGNGGVVDGSYPHLFIGHGS